VGLGLARTGVNLGGVGVGVGLAVGVPIGLRVALTVGLGVGLPIAANDFETNKSPSDTIM
jgi:hypothetical protein